MVYRHLIGVLEVIKKVEEVHTVEDGEAFGSSTCTCPDKAQLFSELEVLKMGKIASTTAAVLSNSNLFSNLGKKVSSDFGSEVTYSCWRDQP